uniref:DUF5056 domain-containing protein n=1 Tax=Syphacia muris TaxID=451379 RepID=A0A0N5AV55_9BILA
MELTDSEAIQIKEYDQRRLKRVIVTVVVIMTVVSIVLVALSLALGPQLDQLGIPKLPLAILFIDRIKQIIKLSTYLLFNRLCRTGDRNEHGEHCIEYENSVAKKTLE